ncbi:MAG TPA: hypothetical protein VGB98_08675, partial [Pyrinomonadaceae bacterium]
SPARGSGARPGVWPRAAALLLASALLLGPLPALAQEEPPPDPELEQIKKEQARVDLEKAKLELAEKARSARFPKPTSSPLAGTTGTNDATFIEELIQGHNSVNAAADVVARRICTELPGPRVIVVHNSSSVGMMTTYAAGRKRIEALKRRYDRVSAEEAAALSADTDRPMPRPGFAEAAGRADGRSLAAGLGAATSVVGSFVDFLSFFRTNVDIRGSTFDVGNAVFVSSLFNSLRNTQNNCRSAVNLYHPAALPPNVMSPPNSPLLNEIEELFAKRDEAEDLKRRIDGRVARKRQQIEDLKKLVSNAQKAIKTYEDNLAKEDGGGEDEDDPIDNIAPGAGRGRANPTRSPRRRRDNPAQKPDPRPGLQASIQQYEDLIKLLEDDIVKLNEGARHLPGVNTQFENLLKDLLAVDEASGISLLTGYLLTESLQGVMETDGSYWLVLDVVKAGGNRKVKTNLIWDVFRGGAKVTHSGGAVVHFNVYNRAGASVLSGVHGQYLKYRSADKIE